MAKEQVALERTEVYIHVALGSKGRVTPEGVIDGGTIMVRYRRRNSSVSHTDNFTQYSQVLRRVKSVCGAGPARVHINGNWNTCHLIEQLMSGGKIGRPDPDPNWPRLFIGGVGWMELSRSPVTILDQMAMLQVPASVGGYHMATDEDYAIYRFLARVTGEKVSVDDDVAAQRYLPFLQQHPAWPAISFIPTAHMGCMVKLLALLIDPRWFVDMRKPDSDQILLNYLGKPVLRRVIQHYFNQREVEVGIETMTQRAGLWFHAWSGCDYDTGTPGTEPRDFLRRKHVYPATVKFLRFLTATWLDNMVPRQTLFVPKLFFGEDDICQAWDLHIRTLAGVTRNSDSDR